MKKSSRTGSAAARYDRALHLARVKHLPPGYRSPQPTSAWPAENVGLLERYRTWLLTGGTSPDVVDIHHLPAAGQVLGLSLKPHSQIDCHTDFQPVLDYIQAKGAGAEWLKTARNSLEKFRKFLAQERGQVEVRLRPVNWQRYCVGLPDWLVTQLEKFYQLRFRQWRAARLRSRTQEFWLTHTRVWRWLRDRQPIPLPADLTRQHLLDYMAHQLAEGLSAATITHSVRCFHIFLNFLQEQDYTVPKAVLRVPMLKRPDRLPRFLTDEQVRSVRDEMERTVSEAKSAVARRDAMLMRAIFYLLWQAGLRLGEVEELRLEDLDLAGRKLMVRNGKGQKDRAVYLTDTSIQAIRAYLPVRGQEMADDQLFLYRQRAVQRDLIRQRVKGAGERVGVKVTPHQLRHTCATQLLNAGCKVTSIQKLLGHRRIDTTLVYARVHDHTVSTDFYAAMERIEKQLELAKVEPAEPLTIPLFTHAALLALANRLAEPELEETTRLELVEQLQNILNGKVPVLAEEVIA